MTKDIYYEIALYINKTLYDKNIIEYDLYIKTEKNLLQKIKKKENK